MHVFLVLAVILLPGAPLVAGLAAAWLKPASALRATLTGSLLSLIATASCVWGLLAGWHAAAFCAPEKLPWLALSLHFDGLSAVMAGLVALLGFTVIRYSGTYLEGDAGMSRFLSWMSLTLGSVLTLLLANNFIVIAAAWISTSACLHHLLLHFGNRPAAVLAARNKFIVSRLGDACLLAASAILIAHYGTSELDRLFERVSSGDTGPIPTVGLLIAGCALLKSAQFPFHSWLPDTMETPTPVSAFMHAGIINAGGFLIIRLSPLMVHAPGALNLIGIVGTITAVFGSVVMLACPSVKRSLAFSTIAQMGFMFFECGMGGFGIALLHLVSHSAYKAHAFLTSGSTVGSTPRAAVKLSLPALAVGLLVGTAIGIGCFWGLQRAGLATERTVTAFDLILLGAISYGFARLWSVRAGKLTAALASALAVGLVIVSKALHAACDWLLSPLPSITPSGGLMITAAVAFGGLFLVQAVLWRSALWPTGRRLYLHAMNGFYISTFVNKWVERVWPSQTA